MIIMTNNIHKNNGDFDVPYSAYVVEKKEKVTCNRTDKLSVIYAQHHTHPTPAAAPFTISLLL